MCEQKHSFYFKPCCSDSSGWQKLNLNSIDTPPSSGIVAKFYIEASHHTCGSVTEDMLVSPGANAEIVQVNVCWDSHLPIGSMVIYSWKSHSSDPLQTQELSCYFYPSLWGTRIILLLAWKPWWDFPVCWDLLIPSQGLATWEGLLQGQHIDPSSDSSDLS